MHLPGRMQNQLAPRDMSRLKRSFAPAGQSTQMIIGATGESDYTLLQTTQALYQGFDLKRVFYSAYIPLNEDNVLPEIGTPPPLYVNTDCIRLIGYCGSMDFRQENYYLQSSRISMRCLILSVIGHYAIWSSSQ